MDEIWVAVCDFKSRLSEYLRLVNQGHTVLITKRGRPVGRLLPAEQTFEERLKAIQVAGFVAWNGQKLGPIVPPAVNRSERQVSNILVEQR